VSNLEDIQPEKLSERAPIPKPAPYVHKTPVPTQNPILLYCKGLASFALSPAVELEWPIATAAKGAKMPPHTTRGGASVLNLMAPIAGRCGESVNQAWPPPG